MWAAQAARMGYRQKIGDGCKVRFWKDQWFGTYSLAIQFWDVYSIVNEQGKTVRDAWDGINLKFSFRRTIDNRIMTQWMEVVQIASSIEFLEEDDVMIWQFNSKGRYSVQSLYAVVNNMGIRQVFTPVMWNVVVPPRVHIFLWLLSNNKTLTRDNLAKRRN
jgi:hypothetical protein